MRTAPIARRPEPTPTESVRRAVPVPGAREVAPKKTVTSTADIRAALARAHQAMTGEAAPPRLLDMLTAHVSHETARGTRMFNFNFGGIKGKSPAGETARYMTREITAAGEEIRLSQPFRAYLSLDAGAADYLHVMRSRFPEALDVAASGDPASFAAALKRRGYYTATEQSYAAAMRALVSDPTAIGRDGAPSVDDGHAAPARAVAAVSSTRIAGEPWLTAEQAAGSSEVAAQHLLTTTGVARLMDALSEHAARIGAPGGDPGSHLG